MKSLIDQIKGKPLLITTNHWFFAPDGKSYRAVWGNVEFMKDSETLGIQTNDRSTNWYAVVGDGKRGVIVAGCQIHYACICEEKPFTGRVTEDRVSDQAASGYRAEREGAIYLAQ